MRQFIRRFKKDLCTASLASQGRTNGQLKKRSLLVVNEHFEAVHSFEIGRQRSCAEVFKISCATLLFVILPVQAEPMGGYEHPWSVLGYIGRTTDNTLGQVVGFNYDLIDETLYSFELAREFAPDSAIRRFFQPVINSVYFVGNVTYRDDKYDDIIELDPYFSLRWENFPWNHVIATTFGVGEGISYASSVPRRETYGNDEHQRLLNYLMLEVTFALPSQPRWQLVARVHHRSGAFGLYHADNSGSTAVGLGLRYYL